MSDTDIVESDLLERYLDGALTAAEEDALERELALDPDVSFDLACFGETVAILRAAEQVQPPASFARHVQLRIRRRNRSRAHASLGLQAFLTEAAVCMIMLFAITAMYFVALEAPAPPVTQGSTTARLHAPDEHILESLGTITSVGMSIQGDALEVELVLPQDRVNDIKNQLEAHPRLHIANIPVVLFQGSAVIRIVASAGVVNTEF